MDVIGTLESSSSVTPSRQPTFTPYILPTGVSLPTPNALDAAVFAEEVLVLLRVKAVLGHLALARRQAKVLGLGDRHPEPVSPADGAVAPVRAHGQVEIGVESNRAAVASPVVCLQRYAGRYVSDLPKSTKSPCLDSKAARNSLRFDFVFIYFDENYADHPLYVRLTINPRPHYLWSVVSIHPCSNEPC
jgi:hypothetical protein